MHQHQTGEISYEHPGMRILSSKAEFVINQQTWPGWQAGPGPGRSPPAGCQPS